MKCLSKSRGALHPFLGSPFYVSRSAFRTFVREHSFFRCSFWRIFALCVISLLLTAMLVRPVLAQDFQTVINIPPDPDRGDYESIGSNAQLNLAAGGVLGYLFRAGIPGKTNSNVEVNITGGNVGRSFNALNGSRVNISGGSFESDFYAYDGSIVNVSGGILEGGRLSANNGSVVNILSGTFKGRLYAAPGSHVTISGGAIGQGFRAADGSTVDISGGSFGDRFETSQASDTTFTGGDFRVDGVLVSGLNQEGDMATMELPPSSLFTGVLADGTPFAFTLQDSDVPFGEYTLKAALLPPIGPTLITASSDRVPAGIRQGQTLLVDAAGSVPDDFSAAAGSVLKIEAGGIVGNNLEAVAATVEMTGGTIGDSFDVMAGTVMNISGGTLGDGFQVMDSDLNVFGGDFIGRVSLSGNSTASISGGTVGTLVGRGSDVTLSGGNISGLGVAESNVNLFGSEFLLDGEVVQGLEIEGDKVELEVPTGVVFSGTLSDGTPFAFSSFNRDSFETSRLTLNASKLPPINSMVITVPGDQTPLGVRQGEQVRVVLGGILQRHFHANFGQVSVEVGGRIEDNFEATGSEVIISGGEIGERFGALLGSFVEVRGGSIGDFFKADVAVEVSLAGGEVGDRSGFHNQSVLNMSAGFLGDNAVVSTGSQANFTGGQIGSGFHVTEGAVVNISGGQIGNGFSVREGAEANITGGSIGTGFNVAHGTVNISGGSIGDGFSMPAGRGTNRGILTISGGLIGEGFHAFVGSQIQLQGIEFTLDGVDITPSLATGVPTTIDIRNVTLSGIFADGSPFVFDLNSQRFSSQDYFDPGAMLTIALTIPEPSGLEMAFSMLTAFCVVKSRRRRTTASTAPCFVGHIGTLAAHM